MAKDGKLDFHKVSENADVEVYQSMTRLETKTNKRTGQTPVNYGPMALKRLDASLVEAALTAFDGADVQSIQVSKESGITVKVGRNAMNPYVEKEPNVERWEPKGGDKK